MEFDDVFRVAGCSPTIEMKMKVWVSVYDRAFEENDIRLNVIEVKLQGGCENGCRL